jgi:hypothetical protein
MDFQHINVKLLLDSPERVDLAAVVPVFHSWIQGKTFADRLLDVADYRHLPAGPGVVLIGNEGDYSVDNTDGLLGVRYNRKATVSGDNQDRLRQASIAALMACQQLENAQALAGQVHFNGQDIEFFINDRLLAPNSEETRAGCLDDFRKFSKKLLAGKQCSLSFNEDPRRLLTVFLKASEPLMIETLVENLTS